MMMMMINLVRFLSLAAVVVASGAPDSLRMVNVVYRHGDRSPETFFPTDPNKDMWPQGAGWLTTEGMQQQYGLGQFLRSEYGNILSPTYKNTEIVVSASDVNRCLMSAYCNLAGLYPPNGSQVWNPELLWQPIPVHTRPQDEDHVLAIEEECPHYNELYNKELQSPAIREVEEKNKVFYDFLEQYSGVKKVDINDAWMISDDLLCTKTHNFTLPFWANVMWGNETTYVKLRKLADFSFNLLYKGTELSRLKGGPLLKIFIRNMLKAVQKQQHYKMYMYSAHDSTVAAVSDALEVFNTLMPPYAAALLVELHQLNPDDYCVKIRYRNETDAPPFTLVHPDCQKECCPMEEFLALTKSRVPQNWEKECGNLQDFPTDNKAIVGLLIGITCLLLLILLVVGYICIRKVQRHNNYTSLP